MSNLMETTGRVQETGGEKKSFANLVSDFAKEARVDTQVEVEFNLLSELVSAFGSNPVLARRAMRELMAFAPAKSYSASLQLLKQGAEGPGTDFLISLLLENDLLILALADPTAFPLNAAVQLARNLCRLEPRLDAKLLRHVMPDPGSGREVPKEAIERVLEVLDQTSDASRLVPVLMKLQRLGDDRIRSKATLLLVRAHRNPDWLQSQLSNPDHRVRSNAIEGLLDTKPGDKELAMLWDASQERHHRVATTALVVLYRNGHAEAAGEGLMKLSTHPQPAFRAAAAWAMGRTEDERFLETVQSMIRGETGSVRRMAMQSSILLRKIREQLNSDSES
jgi:hypothetical protein